VFIALKHLCIVHSNFPQSTIEPIIIAGRITFYPLGLETLGSIVYSTVNFYRKIATSSISLDIDAGGRLSRQGSQTWFLQPFHTVFIVLISTNVSKNGRVKFLALSRAGHLVFKCSQLCCI